MSRRGPYQPTGNKPDDANPVPPLSTGPMSVDVLRQLEKRWRQQSFIAMTTIAAEVLWRCADELASVLRQREDDALRDLTDEQIDVMVEVYHAPGTNLSNEKVNRRCRMRNAIASVLEERTNHGS